MGGGRKRGADCMHALCTIICTMENLITYTNIIVVSSKRNPCFAA